MHLSPQFLSRTVLAGSCAAALLTLPACGGGGDGADPGSGPDPVQGAALECNSPVQAHFSVKFQLAGARIGSVDTEYILGEKTDFNGQAVLQNTQRKTIAYTGPGDLAGLNGNEVIVDYFTVDDANEVATLYGSGNATVWASAPQQVRTEAFVYSSPATSRMFQLMPGQSTDVTYAGTRRLQDWDGQVTTGSINEIDRTVYHGQETVVVPAGSFTACKFTTTTVSGAVNGAIVDIQWFAKGSGILLKEQTTDQGDNTGNTTITSEATEIRQL